MTDDAATFARSIFGCLPTVERARLLSAHPIRKYATGEVIVAEGDLAHSVYVVLDGSVRLFHRAPSGFEIVVMFCRPPVFFGEIEAMLDVPHLGNATALDAARVLVIPHAAFSALLDAHTPFARAIAHDACAKLAIASHNQKALAFQDVPTRLATLLISYAAFAGKKMLDGIELDMPITQDDMANTLGVTRRAVSKALGSWLDQGFLSRRGGHYVLHQLSALANLAASEHIGLAYDDVSGLTIVQPKTRVPWAGVKSGR